MYTKILIPTDGSELAGKAVTHGVELAKAIGAKVTILTVTRPYRNYAHASAVIEDTPAGYEKYVVKPAVATLEAAAALAKAAGVPVETQLVDDDNPYQAIIDAAAASNADLIVMSSHGRKGISALVLGSVTVKVLTHCKIPTLVHRD